MAELRATMIDVGWGDSILLEFEESGQAIRYALIDCNDSPTGRSAFLFVKRRLQIQGVNWKQRRPLFDFVLLTHGHDDHARGLKPMLQEFGTNELWHPVSTHGGATFLLNYAKRSSRVGKYSPVDTKSVLTWINQPIRGAATPSVVKPTVLWPPPKADQNRNSIPYDGFNENNNSVVLMLKYGHVNFLFTGDCEAPNWPQINIPADVKFIQVPHHGARNGLFDDTVNPASTPWRDQLNAVFASVRNKPVLGVSCHISPHKHPRQEVVSTLKSDGYELRRTDHEHHLTFSTDGSTVATKYTHA